jgi:hypothetical protein
MRCSELGAGLGELMVEVGKNGQITVRAGSANYRSALSSRARILPQALQLLDRHLNTPPNRGALAIALAEQLLYAAGGMAGSASTVLMNQ